MNLQEVERLLIEAKALCGHSDFVIVGSLAALGYLACPPDNMVQSLDVDLFIKDDPERTHELNKQLGQGSAFEECWGYYLDPVMPNLPSFPLDWEHRMIVKEFASVRAHFVCPEDVAVSKYMRGEIRDQRWLKEGLRIGLLNLDIIERLAPSAPSLGDELKKAQKLMRAHRAFFTKAQRGF
jgi:hypothetical protein